MSKRLWAFFDPSPLAQFVLTFFLLRFSGLVCFVAVAITFEDLLYILGFDRDYNGKLDGAEITVSKRRLKLISIDSKSRFFQRPITLCKI